VCNVEKYLPRYFIIDDTTGYVLCYKIYVNILTTYRLKIHYSV